MLEHIEVRGSWIVEQFLHETVTEPLSLHDSLIGTKKIRYGNRPDDGHMEYLRRKVADHMQRGTPIDIDVLWGANKAYYQFDITTADLGDLACMKRLYVLQQHVQRFYGPGVKVRIIFEDLCEQVLNPAVSQRDMDYYKVSLAMLIDLFGMQDYVTIVNESELILSRIGHREFKARVAESRNDFFIGHYPTGWIGQIDEKRWSFYMDRVASEHPNATDDAHRWAVCHYLGYGFNRAQLHVLGDGLKGSFNPYPAGVDRSLYKGRLEWKVKPSSNSNRSVPPWCGVGLIDNLTWHHEGVSALRTTHWRTEEIEVGGMPISVGVINAFNTGSKGHDSSHSTFA